MEVLQHGSVVEPKKNESVEKYKLTCPKCGCVFIADIKEAVTIDKTIKDAKAGFICPECSVKVETTRMNPFTLCEYKNL